MRKLTFYANNTIIEIDAEDTTNKNMYLKIKDNKIVVLIPRRIPDSVAQKFVAEHYEKFVKYLDKKSSKIYISFENKFFYFFGKKIFFDLLSGFQTKGVVKKGTKYYIQAVEGNEEEVTKTIEVFLKDELEKYISKSLLNFEEIMQTKVHTFKVLNKSTAWGTNYLAKANITFAQTLSHYSKSVIDYVIVHELAHDKHPDHSNNFWLEVEKYCPEYKELRKSLKHDQELMEE